MKELSLNILDITQNSITAGADNIEISIVEDENGWLKLTITDDGCGMSEETVRNVVNPFYTTRTTRKVGMGIPLLKLASEQTGGQLSIASKHKDKHPDTHGTVISATFDTKHLDFTPLGDIISTVCTIIQGHPEVDYIFCHKTPDREVQLDTKELREALGEGISLAEFEIINWIAEYLREQYEN